MILDCEVSGINSNRFSLSKLGVIQDDKYFLIINRGNKKYDKFLLTKSNVTIHKTSFKFKVPNGLIMIRNVSENTLNLFKTLVRRIIANEQPLPKLSPLEKIISGKPAQRRVQIHGTNQNSLKKFDNSLLEKIYLTNINLEIKQIEKISTMKFLTTLSIIGCHLEKIPYEISNLNRLAFLDMSDNNLETIPMWFCSELKYLKSLILRNNMIRYVPYEIIGLARCQVLDLRNNLIEITPTSLFYSGGRYSKIDLSFNHVKCTTGLSRYSIENFHLAENFHLEQNSSLSALPNFLQKRFQRETLFNICLAEIVSYPLLFKELFNHKRTPRPIYEYLQRILFTCNSCLEPQIEWNSYVKGPSLDYISKLDDYLITCKKCSNE